MQINNTKIINLLIFIFFISIIYFPSISSGENNKALKISTDAYNYDKGFGDFTSTQTMTLRNKQGEETTRYFRGKTLEVNDDGTIVKKSILDLIYIWQSQRCKRNSNSYIYS